MVEGYGVLQPRVSFHLTAATHSRFAALLAVLGGHRPLLDGGLGHLHGPLRRWAASPARGSTTSTPSRRPPGDTFPENQILSHDLIEGNYARCGLLSDTELFDDFPARYHAYARREHRWVRGDWQLLPWLGRRVPTPDGRRAEPPADAGAVEALRQPPPEPGPARPGGAAGPGLDGPARARPGSGRRRRWPCWRCRSLKLVHRASLAGCVRTGTLAGLEVLAGQLPAAGGAGRCCRSSSWPTRRGSLLRRDRADARTRLLVTRRKLLEWETAASTEQRLGTGLARFRRERCGRRLRLAVRWSPCRRVAAARRRSGRRCRSWPPGSLSPLVAFWVSRPQARRRARR